MKKFKRSNVFFFIFKGKKVIDIIKGLNCFGVILLRYCKVGGCKHKGLNYVELKSGTPNVIQSELIEEN